MRKVLKELKNLARSVELDEAATALYNKLIWNSAHDVNKQKQITRFWHEHSLKLSTPIEIAAGTKWCMKSSSGNFCGTFVKDCKAIGIISDIGECLLLDKPSIMPDNALYDDIPYDHDRIQLSSLSSDLLDKVLASVYA